MVKKVAVSRNLGVLLASRNFSVGRAVLKFRLKCLFASCKLRFFARFCLAAPAQFISLQRSFKQCFLRWGVCLGALLEGNAYASVGNSSQGLGDVARNLLAVERSLQSFIQFICLMTGIGLLIASIGTFKKHWQNPSEIALSRPVAMVILGIALVVLAFIPMPVDGE